MVTSKKLFDQNDLIQSDEQVNVDGLIPATTSTAMNHLGSSSPINTYIPPDIIPVLLTIAPETVKYGGSGLVFVNNYGAGVTAQFHDAIIKAENFYQSHFTNSVTLNMSFDLQKISDAFSAFNTYNPVPVTYAALKNALTAHATTADELAAVSSLPISDPSDGKLFDVPVGMARILGLTSTPTMMATGGGGIDDAILLNSDFKWTFGDDAVGVLEHEISEGAMGRASKLGVADGSGHWAPMDLFRYSAVLQNDFTGGKDGKAAFFSIDGNSLLTQFHNSVDSTGKLDGLDLADWDNSIDGDAFGKGGPGDPGKVSSTDLRVMDVLGWNSKSIDHLNNNNFGTAVFHGLRSEYSIATSPGSDGVLHTDVVDQGTAGDGHLDLVNFQHLQFADETLTINSAATIEAANLGVLRVTDTDADASAVAATINAGQSTLTEYVNQLISQAQSTTIPAVAVEASMYGAVGSSAEITKLVTQFLPAQLNDAQSHGLNPLVYASEALGLAFAFGNETGNTAFATDFGPAKAGMPNSTAGDAAFAAAASTAIFGAASTPNLVNTLDGFVTNWKAFYTSHGIPGIAATAANVDLAARGAAWGDMVGVALANNLGPLHSQAVNFLEDAAQGTAVYSASLSSQPNHAPFQGAATASVASAANDVQLTGVAAPIDHIVW